MGVFSSRQPPSNALLANVSVKEFDDDEETYKEGNAINLLNLGFKNTTSLDQILKSLHLNIEGNRKNKIKRIFEHLSYLHACLFSFVCTDLDALQNLLLVNKTFYSRLTQNDIWLELAHHFIIRSVICKYVNKFNKEKSPPLFFYSQFKNMLSESKNSTWMNIINDLYFFDILSMEAEMNALVDAKGTINHSEALSISYKHAGRWALHVPFIEYSDWTGELSSSNLNPISLKQTIHNCLRLLKGKRDYFIGLDKLFTSVKNEPSQQLFKDIIRHVEACSSCESSWYSYVGDSFVFFEEFFSYGYSEDTGVYSEIAAKHFSSWISAEEKHVEDASTEFRILIVEKCFNQTYNTTV